MKCVTRSCEFMRIKGKVVLNIVPLLIVSLLFTRCSTYQAHSLQMSGWDTFINSDKKVIGIGFINTGNQGANENRTKTVADALAFSLQKEGMETIEFDRVRELLKEANLPFDRVLTSDELLQFSGRFPGQYLIQGLLDDRRTDELVREYHELMLEITMHEMQEAKKIGIAKIFAHKIGFVTPEILLQMSQRYAATLSGKRGMLEWSGINSLFN